MSEPTQPRRKEALVSTMFELFGATGHLDMSTRLKLDGINFPPEIIGTRASFRPDVFCKAKNGKSVCIETVTSEDMRDLDKLKDKLFLFSSSAQAYDWDFHIACYAAIAIHVKHFCAKNCIRYSRLWEL